MSVIVKGGLPTTSRSFTCPNCGFSYPVSATIHYGEALTKCISCQSTIYNKNVKELALVSPKEINEYVANQPQRKGEKALVIIFLIQFSVGNLILMIYNWTAGLLVFLLGIAPAIVGVIFYFRNQKRKLAAKADEEIQKSLDRLKNPEYAKVVSYYQGVDKESRYYRYLRENGLSVTEDTPFKDTNSVQEANSQSSSEAIQVETADKKKARDDLKKGDKFKYIKLGREYIKIPGKIIPINNVLWAYEETRTSRYRFGYSETFVDIVIAYIEKSAKGEIVFKKDSIPFGGGTVSSGAKKKAYSFLQKLQENAPFVAFGYRDELEAIFEKHPMDLARLVSERKRNIR